MKKNYYFPNAGLDDEWFGNGPAVCIDKAEAERLIAEWAVGGVTKESLWDQLHIASAQEIETYGVYDS